MNYADQIFMFLRPREQILLHGFSVGYGGLIWSTIALVYILHILLTLYAFVCHSLPYIGEAVVNVI